MFKMPLVAMGGNVLLGAGGCELNGELWASLGGHSCQRVVLQYLHFQVAGQSWWLCAVEFVLAPNEVCNMGLSGENP